MTDRIKGLYVTLDADYRDDDVEVIVAAVRMIKGVAAVTTDAMTIEDQLARMRIKSEVEQRLHQAIRDILSPR